LAKKSQTGSKIYSMYVAAVAAVHQSSHITTAKPGRISTKELATKV